VLQWPPGDVGCYRAGHKDAICLGRPGGYDGLMPYALTLPLDDAAAAEVVRMWHALAEQAGDDGCIRLGYTPHITLAMLADSAPLTEIEEAAFGAARQWAPLSLALAGIGIFPGAPPTPPAVWTAPIATLHLLACHALLYASLARLPVQPYYHSGSWVPHVTLSKEGSSSTARVIEVVTSVWKGPITTRLERIELVKFRPAIVLRTQAFTAGPPH
jgi:2'-5' RNA ligase